MDMREIYGIGGLLVGVLVFFAGWIYACLQWGLLIGILIGWLPAFVIAIVAALLWPLIALGVLFFVVSNGDVFLAYLSDWMAMLTR